MLIQFINSFARIFGVDPIALRAIINIESRGKAFDDNGRMIIRFEAHIFLRKTNNPMAANVFELGEPYYLIHKYHKNNNVYNVHESQDSEYEAFELAKLIDENAAHESISMGSPQIMGFNYRTLNYASAKDMYNDFCISEINQITGMLAFMYQINMLLNAIKNKDWRTVAALYNGSGAVDVYSRLLENEYTRLSNEYTG